MRLKLDHTQRLNLNALLGRQRADVGSIRAIWTIQDRLALNPDEEKAIELKRDMFAGQERVLWNPAVSLSAKEFEFTSVEAARIRAAIETWDQYSPSSDRRWLEPLITVLFSNDLSPKEASGSASYYNGLRMSLADRFAVNPWGAPARIVGLHARGYGGGSTWAIWMHRAPWLVDGLAAWLP